MKILAHIAIALINIMLIIIFPRQWREIINNKFEIVKTVSVEDMNA